MARSSRRREARREPSFVRNALVAAGEGAVRNPVAVGGGTAFLVAFSFISANALWYQPHFYKDAFFSTRNPVHASPRRSSAAVLAKPRPVAPALAPAANQAPADPSDPVVQKVQTALTNLKLYSGTVDGITGPQTQKAIADFQKSVNLPVSGHVDGLLLDRLGINDTNPPKQAPPPAPRPQIDASTTQSVAPEKNEAARVVRIQAGLKAFGNDGIELDGLIGPKTSAAIKEFQSLFGLKPTGQPDAETFAKMREAGLIN